jgi:hypothetical protein
LSALRLRPSIKRKLASTGTGGTGLALIGIGVSTEGALSTILIVVGSGLALLGGVGWLREGFRPAERDAPVLGEGSPPGNFALPEPLPALPPAPQSVTALAATVSDTERKAAIIAGLRTGYGRPKR